MKFHNCVSQHAGKVLAALLCSVFSVSSFAVQTWAYSTNGSGVTSGTGYLPGLCGTSSSALSGGYGASNCGTGLALTGVSTGTGAQGATTTTSYFNTARIYDWNTGGFGVVASNENPNDPGPHAFDNRYGTDAMLLNFTSGPTNLSTVKIGWNGNDNPIGAYTDSDLSIFMWAGAGAPVLTGSGVGPGNLISSSTTAGWQLVGNYYDVGTSTSPSNNAVFTGSQLYSSYWLISAYNASYAAGVTNDTTVDAFKVLAISASNCGGTYSGNSCLSGGSSAPEPGSLALLAAGLLGVYAVRRRHVGEN